MRLNLVFLLWRFQFFSRRWCWADAVMWASGFKPLDDIKRADHTCFYCNACNTQAEINSHIKGDQVA